MDYVDERKNAAQIFKESPQAGKLYQAVSERDQCSEAAGPSRQYGIRQRIAKAIAAFETTQRRAAAAYRANQIIEQHPEFVELLDLLNEI